MTGRWIHVGALLVLASTGIVMAPSCVEHNNTMIFIEHCMVPDPDTCTTKADPAGSFLSGGSLDLAYDDDGSYGCNLLLGNQLIGLASSERARAETSRVTLEGFDVTIRDAFGNTFTDSKGDTIGVYTVPTAGFIDPGDVTTPGYSIAGALLIDSATATVIRDLYRSSNQVQDVVVEVIAHGKTLGGEEVQSAPWTYPISVCEECSCK